MVYFIIQCKQIYDKFVKDEITVYAAQASFFIVLSAFPFIMILLTMIQMVPSINQNDLMLVISRFFPQSIYPLIETIIMDLYTTAPAAILSVTTIITLWSASRGMIGIERGLNRIIGCTKHRNYVMSRLISSGYTIIFMVVCVMSLVLLVFGSFLQKLLLKYIPFMKHLAPYLISMRTVAALAILITFFVGLYSFLPYERQRIRYQVPGAIFSTVCWLLFSLGFSIYFTNFSRFSYMYGSLAAVVMLMLWLYFCICILFMGAEINHYLADKRRFRRHARQLSRQP